MDRELLLGLLLPLFAGPLGWVWGAFCPRVALHRSGRTTERVRWRALWRPAWAPAATIAALVGWAVDEPEQAESLHLACVVVGIPVALVWLRAGSRAVLALLLSGHTTGPAIAVGLLSARVRVDEAFMHGLDADEQQAVLAHEHAHARKGDPLRIWLAQIVTDLQWPMPAARARNADWRASLELARDEEARLDGADGAALASAILKSLRSAHSQPAAVATLVGAEEVLTERLRRNLDTEVVAVSRHER